MSERRHANGSRNTVIAGASATSPGSAQLAAVLADRPVSAPATSRAELREGDFLRMHRRGYSRPGTGWLMPMTTVRACAQSPVACRWCREDGR